MTALLRNSNCGIMPLEKSSPGCCAADSLKLRSLPVGIKPVQLSYPAEWLLDIFNNGSKRPGYQYQYMPEPHPMPWMWIILVLLGIGIALGVKICYGF